MRESKGKLILLNKNLFKTRFYNPSSHSSDEKHYYFQKNYTTTICDNYLKRPYLQVIYKTRQ